MHHHWRRLKQSIDASRGDLILNSFVTWNGVSPLLIRPSCRTDGPDRILVVLFKVYMDGRVEAGFLVWHHEAIPLPPSFPHQGAKRLRHRRLLLVKALSPSQLDQLGPLQMIRGGEGIRRVVQGQERTKADKADDWPTGNVRDLDSANRNVAMIPRALNLDHLRLARLASLRISRLLLLSVRPPRLPALSVHRNLCSTGPRKMAANSQDRTNLIPYSSRLAHGAMKPDVWSIYACVHPSLLRPGCSDGGHLSPSIEHPVLPTSPRTVSTLAKDTWTSLLRNGSRRLPKMPFTPSPPTTTPTLEGAFACARRSRSTIARCSGGISMSNQKSLWPAVQTKVRAFCSRLPLALSSTYRTILRIHCVPRGRWWSHHVRTLLRPVPSFRHIQRRCPCLRSSPPTLWWQTQVFQLWMDDWCGRTEVRLLNPPKFLGPSQNWE